MIDVLELQVCILFNYHHHQPFTIVLSIITIIITKL